MWLAPNLVTLLGFFCILGNIVVMEVYVPDLVGPVRRHFEDSPRRNG
jgi:ethanolaminephosphotransferase